jgi:hypothetical protein
VNKKVIIVFIALLGSGLFFYKFKSVTIRPIKEINKAETHQEESFHTKSSLETLKKYETQLDEKLTESRTWKEIQDFSTPSAILLYEKKLDKEKLKNIISKTIPKTIQCLKKNFCGVTPDKDDGYFDPNNTPGHKSIERLLQITNNHYNELDVQGLITQEDLIELIGFEHSEISELATSLWIKGENSIPELLERSEQWKGESGAKIYALLSNKIPKDERSNFIESLKKTLSSKDPYTLLSIVEKLKVMPLTIDEFREILVPVCQFQYKEDQKHNWLAFRKNISDTAIANNSTLDEFCP